MLLREKNSVFIIAEGGVNHDGSLESAYRLVDIAKEANVDAVKFQTFKPGELTGKYTPYAGYIDSEYGCSRDELTAHLALSFDDFRLLRSYCEEKGIIFLSTPDGYESLNFLSDDLNIPVIKIGSTEVTNHDFIQTIATKKREVILSTGLSTLGEVEKAVEILFKKLYLLSGLSTHTNEAQY